MYRLEELREFYNTHDDIENGVYLKNKKYWYLFYGDIQYGLLDDADFNAQLDGSCENRITFYGEMVTFKCSQCFKKSSRSVLKESITDNRYKILEKYAQYLKDIGSGDRQLQRLSKTYPELVL